MKKLFILIMFAVVPLLSHAQKFAVKSNLLYDATTTINLGIETIMGQSTTLDVSGNYNPWKFSNQRQWKHWMVQPEFRWWFCSPFNGHFMGLHAHGGQFNVGGLKWFSDNMERNRYEGHFIGGGVSWGYSWLLSTRWNMEVTVGAGYARIWERKYPIAECGEVLKKQWKNYWGPTKVGLSLIYVIK